MMRSSGIPPIAVVMALMLAGCHDDGNSPSPNPSPPPPPPLNTAPTANAGSDQVANAGSTVTLDGSGSSDTNGTIASYAWTQTAGTAVTLAPPGNATTTFVAPDSGTLTFQLTVTDNGGASHSDTVTVTVNGIPVANAGPNRTVAAGAAVSLAGSATDDGTLVSYEWTQTGGPPVPLDDANAATASFLAPSTPALLTFQLTVTDDLGATHSDSVSVNVIIPSDTAPVIGRHPNNPITLEHGSAMLIAGASGEDLTYEWRRGGTVVKTGPEPFLLLENLATYHTNDCYYVVVINEHGSATSEEGCLTVEPIDWLLDRTDDPNNGDDRAYAMNYGMTLMKMAQTLLGPLTGVPANVTGFTLNFGPPDNCASGTYDGATLDGIPVTPGTLPPLGRHVISSAWTECYEDIEASSSRHGAWLVEYDFPDAWGIGSVTMHLSEPYFNGTLQATITTTGTGVDRVDDIQFTIVEGFSSGDIKKNTTDDFSIQRHYGNNNAVNQAIVNVTAVAFSMYDANGGAGNVGIREGGHMILSQNFDSSDSGDPEFSSNDIVLVASGGYLLAVLTPIGSYRGWGFSVMPEEECPEDAVCADLP